MKSNKLLIQILLILTTSLLGCSHIHKEYCYEYLPCDYVMSEEDLTEFGLHHDADLYLALKGCRTQIRCKKIVWWWE